MILLAALFLYGLAAGFLLVRLRRGRGAAGLPLVAGWVMLAMSLTLATALLAWQLWLASGGKGGG